jgi:hypothetical protein
VTEAIVRLIRFASIAICLIVIASFAVFAIDQTKNASGEQQAQLNSEVPGAAHTSSSSPPAPTKQKKENSFHKLLDEASNELTSPFAGVVSGSTSQWTIRGVKLLLALIVYGFGLGFVARVLRVRV